MPFFANSRQRLWIMTALREYQARLADALLAGKRDAAMALFCGEAERRSLGLRVYANNWMHTLISALGDTFPAVRALIGEDAFMAIAAAYVRNNPQARDDLLIWYGSSFPDVLDAAGVADPPYLGDLARLEHAWLEAYHAPEAHPLPLAALAALTQEQLVRARLPFHPSVRLLHSHHAIDRIWERYHRPAAHETAPQPQGPAWLAVLRPDAEVIIMRISAPTFAALVRLRAGEPFGQATAGLVPADHLHELQALIAASLFTKLETLETQTYSRRKPRGGNDHETNGSGSDRRRP